MAKNDKKVAKLCCNLNPQIDGNLRYIQQSLYLTKNGPKIAKKKQKQTKVAKNDDFVQQNLPERIGLFEFFEYIYVGDSSFIRNNQI